MTGGILGFLGVRHHDPPCRQRGGGPRAIPGPVSRAVGSQAHRPGRAPENQFLALSVRFELSAAS